MASITRSSLTTELKVSIHLEGVEFEAAPMVRVVKGLSLEYLVVVSELFKSLNIYFE